MYLPLNGKYMDAGLVYQTLRAGPSIARDVRGAEFVGLIIEVSFARIAGLRRRGLGSGA
jgi:hypothetical protein